MRRNYEKNYCIIFAFIFSGVLALITLCMLPSLLS